MTTPEIFFLFTVIGALFAMTGAVRGREVGPLVPVWFFSGWLASELPLFHIAWQMLATFWFVARGALSEPEGWIGLLLAIGSWKAFLGMHLRALEAPGVFDRALADCPDSSFRQALGAARMLVSDRPSLRDLVLPFQMSRPGVERIRNLSYGGAGKRNQLDIWRPARREGLCPTLLQVHGGGWCMGNKDQQALPLLNMMAQLGWACVAINYRLSPKDAFPAHIIDVKKAIAWIRKHGPEYGCDPDLIVVTGGSAGGHLAALTGLTGNYAPFQPGFEDVDTSVAGCAPFYGIYDFLDRNGFRGSASMEGFLSEYVMQGPAADEERWKEASPVDHVRPDAPPFLLIHGTDDTLAFVEDGRAMAEKLRAVSRAPVMWAELPGAQHAFDNFRSIRAEAAIRAVARFAEAVRATHPRKTSAPEPAA